LKVINAYYNGHSFVPMKPVQAKKNQKAIVTIIDESLARDAAAQLKRRLSLLLTAIMTVAIFAAAPMASAVDNPAAAFASDIPLTPLATTPGSDDICAVYDANGVYINGFTNLKDALSAVQNGDKIIFLKDIVDTSPSIWGDTSFSFPDKSYSIDMNGYSLNMSNRQLSLGGTVTIYGGKLLTAYILYSWGGNLILKGNLAGNVYAYDGAKVNITGDITSGGAYACNGSTLIVAGNIESTGQAAVAEAGSNVIVTGNIISGGVGAYGENSTLNIVGNIPGVFAEDNANVNVTGNSGTVSARNAKVTINGDIIASDDYGVSTVEKATVNVNGNITAVLSGVRAEGGTVNVTGNVTASDYVVYTQADDAVVTKVTIDGKCKAGSKYIICIDGSSKPIRTASQNDAKSSKSGYKQYSEGKTYIWIKVPAAASGIRAAQTTFYVVKGKTLTIPYMVDRAVGETKAPVLTWTSSDDTIASVTQSGMVKGLVAGKTAKITVTSDNGMSKVFTVKVVKAAVKATGVSVSKPPTTMKVGDSKVLKVKISPAKATGAVATFKSSKSAIVSVDKAGKVTALKKGTAKITVKACNKSTVITITVK